jgi:hypothetical protein
MEVDMRTHGWIDNPHNEPVPVERAIAFDSNVVEFSCPILLARFVAQLTRDRINFATRVKGGGWAVLIQGVK